MTDNLSRLIGMAKSVRMTESDREEQRRSFVYGNTAIENAAITRELVDEVAEQVAASRW